MKNPSPTMSAWVYLYSPVSLASSSVLPQSAASFCSSGVVFPMSFAALFGVFTAIGTSWGTTGTLRINANPSSKLRFQSAASARTSALVNLALRSVTVTYFSNLALGCKSLYHARCVTNQISGSSPPYLIVQSRTSMSLSACGGRSCGTNSLAKTTLGNPCSPSVNFLALPIANTLDGFDPCTLTALFSSNLSRNSYSSRTRIGSVSPGTSFGTSRDLCASVVVVSAAAASPVDPSSPLGPRVAASSTSIASSVSCLFIPS